MKTTLDEMQVFIAIVDSGSITAAADVLGQTVSAASRTMSRLELTEEGRAYLEQARKIVAAVEESEELMSLRRNQPAGRLRVDAASPFMLHVIAPLVPGYRKRYPQVELELNSNEGNIDLLERRTDLAIRIGRLKDSSLHAVPLGHSRVRVLASPGYLDAHGTPRRVADLASHILLGFSQLEALNEWPLLEADGQALHIKPHVRAFSGETLRQLALNDGGVVCLSDFMTRGDRASGALQQLLVKQTQDVRQPINAVYYRNTAISSRIKSFIDYMVQALGPRGFE
jgi:DNA-binding transcriptional LysR family regulator